jgi:dephospho-CoA kinase
MARPGGAGASVTQTVRIGLTGPIGCGKTTIASWLRAMGGVTIDADELARAITDRGEPTLPQIRARFGDSVFLPDGSVDRAALAGIVFQDAAALRDLEAIVHPAVRRRIDEAVMAAERQGAPFVAVEAIKLVEAGYANECDEVWLVECAPAAQAERLRARGVPSSDAARRISAQGDDLAERLAVSATRRISTDGPPSETRAAVESALREALSRERRDA